jgi:hypothetical protein
VDKLTSGQVASKRVNELQVDEWTS